MKVQIIIPHLLLLFSFGWSSPVPKKNKMATSCQTATIALDANGMATLQPTDVDAGSTPAPGNYLAVSPNVFDCSALGSAQNVRLSEINPGGGEVSACTTTVTVVDNLPPNLSCVSSFPVYLNPSGFAAASPFFLVTSLTDNCGTPPFPSGVAVYDCSDIGGPYNFTFGTADLSGNSVSCTVAITVVDNLPPTALCQNATVQLDAAGMGTLSTMDVDNGSTDNCGISNYSLSQTSFDCSDLGNQTVTLTLTDDSNNSATCTATVSVVDNIAPTLLCQPTFTAKLNGSGFAAASAFFLALPPSDNCGTASFPLNSFTYGCADIGQHVETFSSTDGSGNVGTCSVTVTVVDDLEPLISCQDINVSPTQSSGITISPQDLEASTSTDNCGINTKSVTPNTFTCADAGSNTAVLTVSDINGNVASCTSNIMVNCILPVEWGPVNAIPDGEKVRINWSTLQEINNDYFLVEHSTDGVQFEEIAQLEGKGNTSELAFYQIIHPNPTSGSNYYRIRQVDFDGSYKFSPIVHAQMVMYPSPGELRLYPNPVKNRLYYQLPGQDLENLQIQVFNTLGKIMAEELPTGYLQLDDWPAGAYWLVVTGRGDRWQRMFVKE